MKYLLRLVARYGLLTVITVLAAIGMWWVSVEDGAELARLRAQIASPVPDIAEKRPTVAVEPIAVESCEITVGCSGKIRPWEVYTLGFEVGGRVEALGENAAGEPLDDGAPVKAGQVIARIDDRIYKARRQEAAAQLEQARSDIDRARQLRDGPSGAITDAEYQELLTKLALAKSQFEIASKNLEDTVIASPVDGDISHRMVEPGETIGANKPVFEIVQNDPVLLVVDIPESRVRELQSRWMMVESAREAGEPDVFRAYVELEGRDMYGRPWPRIEAEVYRIAQLADERTGLFEVEIKIPNADRALRSGMVASAQIVTDVVRGYRVPESAVVFRGDHAHLFSTKERDEPLQVMFWQVAQSRVPEAVQIDLERWIDLGMSLVVPQDVVELSNVVVRGQQRVSDGQLVRTVALEPADDEESSDPRRPAEQPAISKSQPVAGGDRS